MKTSLAIPRLAARASCLEELKVVIAEIAM